MVLSDSNTKTRNLMKKRLALFVFFEKNGIVREYVLYYLKALKEVAQDIFFIANGELQQAGRQRVEALGCQVFQRENTGYDFAAWQSIIVPQGEKIVREYDELILCNSSCYGPIWPFKQCFDKIEAADCDFWGMTLHDEVNYLFIPGNRNSRILEHLQSYFLVIRSSVLKSEIWSDWWKEMSPAASWQEVVGLQETKLTAYLAEHHFRYASLMNYTRKKGFGINVDSTFLCADINLQQDRIPLVKRKLFATPVTQLSKTAPSFTAAGVFNYIKKHSDYPVSYIWEDLLATQKLSAIKDSIHLNYILPSEYAASAVPGNELPHDVALICYGYYPDLAEEMVSSIATMPDNAHIYIISSREDTLETYRACMRGHDFSHVEYRLKPNRGRDISALLITARDIVQRHAYVCFVHDKKTSRLHPLLGRDFFRHCIECCLHSKQYVLHILQLLDENSACGMVVPPIINTPETSPLGLEIGANMDTMKQAYEFCQLQCPFDNAPVAPFGTCFWARREALLPLYRKDWQFTDFPDEPLPDDATISHGIERILPMAAQDAGYYTAWCSPDSYAAMYMNDMSMKLRQFRILETKQLVHKLRQRHFRFKLLYILSLGLWKRMRKKIKKLDNYLVLIEQQL